MQFITFDLMPGGKVLVMNMNALTGLDDGIDYRKVVIKLNSLATMVLEENEADGINIVMNNGEKYNVNQFEVPGAGGLMSVTRVGTFTGTDIDTNEKVLDKLITIGNL